MSTVVEEATMSTIALITGIAGQDGSYLAELLLSKGYEVHGLIRNSNSLAKLDEIPGLAAARSSGALMAHVGNFDDPCFVEALVETSRPAEIYNLAAQSHVGKSFERPAETIRTNGIGVVVLLETIRRLDPPPRLFQAGSCEMFGAASQAPQSETTPFAPRSPYAASKMLAHYLVQQYRTAYGLFASNGILYPHESPRRPPTFVMRKITKGVAAIVSGKSSTLALGNLDAVRDWGFAGDYVHAMWRILQLDTPDDFVIATGQTHTVRDAVATAFGLVGIDWQDYVQVDPAYFRPLEPGGLVGNPAKIRHATGWQPSVGFEQLIKSMLAADLAQADGSSALSPVT